MGPGPDRGALLVVGWSVGLIVIGLILRVGQGAEILAWGLLAMVMPLSGIFYPVSACPGPSSRWLPCCPPPMRSRPPGPWLPATVAVGAGGTGRQGLSGPADRSHRIRRRHAAGLSVEGCISRHT